MKGLLLIAFLAFAVQTPAGLIEGTISRSGTNQPIAGVQIQLGGQFNAMTDETGHFAIEGILPGNYPLFVRREGYLVAGPSNTEAVLMNRPDLNLPIFEITVRPGEQIRDFHIEMKTSTGLITGTVRDPDGAPVSNVKILLNQATYVNGRKGLSLVPLQGSAGVLTDDRGNYRIFGLPPGEFYLVASFPIPISASISTRKSTYYPQTPYVDDAKPINLRDGEEASHADITVQTGAAVTISGTVIPPFPGTPIVALMLTPLSRNPDAAVPTLRPATTGGDRFIIDVSNLSPDTYDLFVQGVARDGDFYGMVPVVIRGQAIDGIRIPLHAGVDLKGTATIQGDVSGFKFTSVPINIEPIGNAVFDTRARRGLLGVGGGRALGLGLPDQQSTIPDTFGAFIIRSIPEGRYRILPTLPAGASIVDVVQGEKSVLSTGLVVSAEPPEPIKVTITLTVATIEGTLFNSHQEGLGLSSVVLMPDVAHRNDFSIYHTATTDFRGHFSFKSVLPGEYKLFAWSNIPDGAWTNSNYMKQYEDLGTTVVVREGENLKNLKVNVISK